MDNKLSEKIDEIRQRADIVDVVSRHINVTKKGRNYFAICPFHDDTNPSLSVSRDLQIFKCFTCNEKGNVFDFVKKYKRIGFLEAVKEVADLVGIDFKLTESKPQNITNLKNKVLFDILKDATLFYKNSLASSITATQYCKNRSLSGKILSDFNIGFSPDSEKLIKYLYAKGYKKQDIFDSGLTIEHNGELIDRFANRLVFPITDLDGNVVAFSGRIIEKSDMAKYVNSPETEIFIKGKTLFNYATALSFIKKENKMYICEGFMDCIALNKIGCFNSVALMGTASTKEHLKLFKYLNVEIILALDGDNAGNLNANKLAHELLKLGLSVKVIPNYNDVKDLDEYLNKYGPESLKEHLSKVQMNVFDFDFYVAGKLGNLENLENKKKFLRSMCQSIAKMSDEDIDIYSNKLHNELGFSMNTITSLINENKKKNTEKDVAFDGTSNKQNKNEKVSKEDELQLRLLVQMIEDKEAIETYILNMNTLYFNNETYRKIALMIGEYYLENKERFNINYLYPDLFTKAATEYSEDDKIANSLDLIEQSKQKYPSYSKNYFEDVIYELREIVPLENQLKQLSEDIKFADKSTYTTYLYKSMAIKKLIAEKMEKKGRR